MYHATTRLLTILHILHTNVIVPADVLAARVEVSTRTVRRYVTMLRDMGLPVEVNKGVGGGYYLGGDTRQPPSIFSQRELEILRQVLSDASLERLDHQEVQALRQKLDRLLEP